MCMCVCTCVRGRRSLLTTVEGHCNQSHILSVPLHPRSGEPGSLMPPDLMRHQHCYFLASVFLLPGESRL